MSWDEPLYFTLCATCSEIGSSVHNSTHTKNQVLVYKIGGDDVVSDESVRVTSVILTKLKALMPYLTFPKSQIIQLQCCRPYEARSTEWDNPTNVNMRGDRER